MDTQPATTIDPNVFYYSFSTIAQTLAGAFGFLASVVLFRLQSLNSQLELIAANLMVDPRTFVYEPFRTLFAYQRWSLFVENVKRDQEPSNRNPVFKNLNFLDLGAMDNANNQIVAIRFWFLLSMLMTLIGMALSLTALVLLPWIQSTIILIALLVLGVVCLMAYVRLVILVLK